MTLRSTVSVMKSGKRQAALPTICIVCLCLVLVRLNHSRTLQVLRRTSALSQPLQRRSRASPQCTHTSQTARPRAARPQLLSTSMRTHTAAYWCAQVLTATRLWCAPPRTVLDGDSTRVSLASSHARTRSPYRARARLARRDTYSDSSKHVAWCAQGAHWTDAAPDTAASANSKGTPHHVLYRPRPRPRPRLRPRLRPRPPRVLILRTAFCLFAHSPSPLCCTCAGVVCCARVIIGTHPRHDPNRARTRA